MPAALQDALNPAAQNTLRTALNAQAGPVNPKTPAYRGNAEHDWYLALQGIRAATKDAVENVGEEKGPKVRAILSAIRESTERLMAGVEPETVALSFAADLVRDTSPQIALQLDQAKAATAAPPQPGGQAAVMADSLTPGGALAPLGQQPMAPPAPSPVPAASTAAA